MKDKVADTETAEIHYELPRGWMWTKLGDIIEPSNKKIDPKKFRESLYIGLEHIEKETGKLLGYGNSNDVRSTKAIFSKGDLLYGKLRPYLNKVYVADFDGICSTDILVFPKLSHLSSKYLAYRIMCMDFVRYANQSVSGVQHPRTNYVALSKFAIPLPPLVEQHRIVDKIEELFTKLDAGIESLKKVQSQLKQYRQAVLKSAVEGKLTAEWRTMHKDELEPASVLLERIRKERREKWETEQLEIMKTKGITPKNDSWKKKYKEPDIPKDSDILDLPIEWKLVSGDIVSWFITSGSRGWAKYYSDSGSLFLRIGNLNHDTIALDMKKIQKVNPPASAESIRTRVRAGDILISITADVGMIGLVNQNIGEAFINQHIALVRLLYSIEPTFIAWFLTCNDLGQKQFINLQRGATKMGLGLDDIRSVHIPLPPILEQQKIVEEIELRLSIADEVESVINAELKRAERLRQSILKQAFSGKLVPQDPNDEPASVLLERIKQEKEKNDNQKKNQKGNARQMKLL